MRSPRTSQYAVWGYVRETNAAPSSVTINAGSGTVQIRGAVGATKELSNLSVTAGAFTADGIKTSSSLTVNISGTASASTISGAGTLTKSGAGTLTLTANNTYSGSTTVNAGVLQLGAGQAAGTLGEVTTLGSTSSANYTANISLANSATLRVNNTARQIFSGAVSGAGALNKQVSGSLLLTGNNAGFSGAMTVDAGTLGAYSNTALGAGGLTLASSTNLLIGRSVTQLANNITLAGNANVDLDTEVDYLIVGGGGGGGAHVGGGGGGGGVLMGSSSQLIDGDFAVTVGTGGVGARHNGNPNNTDVRLATSGGNSSLAQLTELTALGGGHGASWNWQTAANGGSGGGGAFGSGAGGPGTGTLGQGFSGGTGGGLDPDSYNNGYLTGGGGGAGQAGAHHSKVSSPMKSGDGGVGLASSITGSQNYYGGGGGGGLHNDSASVVGLGGLGGGGNGIEGTTTKAQSGAANTGGGGGGGGNPSNTTSEGGDGGTGLVIVRYLGGSAGSGGTVTGGSGTAAGQTLHRFTTTGANTLTLNALTPVLSGNITGAGNLTVDATGGTVALTGTNTYANTTISGGTIKVGNGGTTGTLGTGAVINSAALVLDRTDAFTVANDISGIGSLTKLQDATATLTGANSYGTTTISAGTLQIGAGSTSGTLGSGAVTVTNNSTLSFNRSDDVMVANAISGAGDVSKHGNNTLTLTTSNIYTGATAVNAGTLRLGNAAALGTAAGGTTVASGAVLDLNGQTLAAAEALTLNGTGISGGGALINSSATAASYAGLLTLGSASSIVGGMGTIALTNTGTISGSAFGLTLGGAQGGSITSTIGTGAGTLTKEGAGTWTLSGANTYTGLTTVSHGTLRLGNASALGTAASGTTVSSGAALDLHGQTVTAAEALTLSGTGINGSGALHNTSATAATFGGPITLAADTTIKSGAADLSLNGAIGGPYALTLSNTGLVNLGSTLGSSASRLASMSVSGPVNLYGDIWTTGAQTYSGNVGVGNDVGLYSTTGGITIGGSVAGMLIPGTLLYEVSDPLRAGNAIQYSFNGASTYSGAINRISYRLQVSVNGTPYHAEVSFDPWADNLTAADLRIPDLDNQLVVQRVVQNMIVSSNMTATSVPSKSSGVITGSGFTGYLELWPWDYAPDASVTAGVPTSNDSLYDHNDSPTGGSRYGSFQVHNITTGSNQTVMAWNHPFTFDGNAPDVGLGNYVGSASTHPDWTFTSGNSLGTNDFRLQVRVNETNPSLILSGGTGAVNVTGATSGLRALTVSSDAATSQLTGAISNSAPHATTLTKDGTGVLVLAGANTYTGATNVNAGTLRLDNVSALGTAAAGTTVASDAVLDLNGQTVTLAEALTINGTGITGGGALINSSETAASYAGLLTLNSASSIVGDEGTIALTNAGTISGSSFGLTLGGAHGGSVASIIGTGTGTLTKADTGTWNLTGANTYTGATAINAGTLQLGIGSTSGSVSSSSAITLDGGTLSINRSAAQTLSNSISLTADSTINTVTTDTTLSGVISGTGFGFTKTGSTGLILTNSNAYTGATIVSAGTLQLGSGSTAGSISSSSAITLGGATLSINRSAAQTLANEISLTADSTINTATTDTTLSGVISGTGFGLTKTGSSGLVLTGDSTYTGATIVSAGTLQLGSGSTTGSISSNSAITLGGGTLSINRSAAQTLSNSISLTANSLINTASSDATLSGVISGAGFGLTKTGSTGLVLTNSNTYGTTTISAGTLQIGAGGTSGSLGSGAVSNNGTLRFNRSDDVTVANAISGATGTLVQDGNSTLTLTSNNTYGGTTTINAGTLVLQHDAPNPTSKTFAGTGGLRIQSNGASFTSAFSTAGWSFASTLGGLTLGKSGNTAGVTVGAALTFNGPINIFGGAVALNSNMVTTSTTTGDIAITTTGLSGAGNLSLADGRMLSVTQSGTSHYAGVIAGTGASLVKAGAGRLNLTAANTYTGGTTVSAGSLGLYANASAGTGDMSLSTGTALFLGRAVTQVANNIALAGNATVDLDTAVEYLIVGGGGGGSSGGGGGGGVVSQTSDLDAPSYVVTVGAGGTAGTPATTHGGAGGASLFNGVSASGGGGGGRATQAGLSGASGGGAGADSVAAGGSATQGFAGASGASSATGTGAGGGGGAGGAGISGYTQASYNALYGLTGQNTMGGDGGVGALQSFVGTSTYYGGGGGGGSNNNIATPQAVERAGQGGLGGGGRGSNGDRLDGAAGTANTGGGGGGGDWEAASGGAGGSGVVIARYLGGSGGSGGSVSTGSGTATGYTLHTFNASGTLALNALTPVLSGNISGPGSLALDATGGTVALTGANTYANTTISGGTLKVGNSGTTGTLGSGAVINSAALVLDRTTALTVANDISGIGSLTKLQNATATLTGNNSYSGTTTISAGTLQIGAGGTTGTLGSGAVTNSGTLSFNRSDDATVANAISGTGALVQDGNSTLTLTSNNTYGGMTTINAGTLVLQHDAPNPTSKTVAGTGVLRIESSGTGFTSGFSTAGWSFGSDLSGLTLGKSGNTADVTVNSALNVNGFINIFGGAVALSSGLTTTDATTGHIGITTTGLTGAGGLSLASGRTLTVTQSGTSSYAGLISGTGVNVVKAGAGTLTLSAANSFTGSATVNAGTLRSAAAGVIHDSAAVSVADGATWDLNGFAETVGSVAGAGNIALGSASLTAGGDNTSTTFSGVAAGTGGLTKVGTGTWTLSGANTFSGAIQLSAGTLRSGAAAVLADGSAVSVAESAMWDLNNFAETVGSIAGAGQIKLGSATLTSGGSNASTTFSGLIADSGGLTKTGSGVLTLSGANTYEGSTLVSGGTLAVGHTSGLGTTAGGTSVASGAALDLLGVDVLGEALTLAGGTLKDATSSWTGDVSLTANSFFEVGSGDTLTISGVVSDGNGGFGITKSGAGTLVLAADNTYSGASTISVGLAKVGHARALGTGAVTVSNAAALDLAGYSISNALTLSGTGTGAGADSSGVLFNSASTAAGATAAITLSANATFKNAGDLTLGTINGGSALTLQNTGAVFLNGAVGDSTALTSLTAAGPVTLDANVSTTGTQTYSGAVTLSGGSRTLAGSIINTRSTLAGGGNALTITGAADIDGDYSNLSSLSISGTTDLGGNVTTSGAQTYSGAVTLSGADRTLTGSTINTRSTLAGGGNALTITGAVDMDGAFSGLSSLSISGAADLGGNVTTSGAQTYSDAVTLSGGGRTLAGSIINTRSTLAGGTNALMITGAADIDGAYTGLSSLGISGVTDLGANVTTSGTQTYSDAVTLSGGARTLTGSIIHTRSTLAGGANALTITGVADIDGEYTDLSSLSVSGTTDLGGNVTTSGAQTYTGAVTLSGADRTLTTSNDAISFVSTLNSEASFNRGLTLALGTGQATFGGVVGGTRALGAIGITGTLDLNANVAGAASFSVSGAADLGGDVTTSGAQTYWGAVTVSAASTLSTSNSNVSFDSTASLSESLTVNTGTGAGDITFSGAIDGAKALSLSAGTGAITLSGTVGQTTRLGLVTLNSSGATTLAQSVQADSVTTNAGGTLALNGGSVHTTGAQTYGEAITLGANTTVTGTTINTQSTLAGGGHALTISGAADINGAYTGLSSLSISDAADLGGNVTTTGTQAYTGAVTLSGSDRTLATTDSAISFVSAVNSEAGQNRALTLALGAGQASFGNTVGGTRALGAIGITGALDLNANVAGAASFSVSGAADLGGNVTTTGTQIYSNAVTLSGGDRTLTTTNNSVTFGNVVNSESGQNRALTLALGTGQATFGNTVGSTQALGAIGITGALDLNAAVANAASLSVSGEADVGANVTTAGTQTYSGAVTLSGGARTLTGSTIHTRSTLAGGGNALAITGAADIDGAYTGLSSLSISGATDLGGNVTSTGTQTYSNAVTLSGGDRTLTTSNNAITFANTVNSESGQNLALTMALGTGQATFGNTVGGTQALGAIGITGTLDLDADVANAASLSASGVADLGGDVTTSGAQTYSAAVTLSGANRTLAGSIINTRSTLAGGGHALTISGAADIDGAYSGLSSLSISGAADLGGNVTTSGTQTYTGTVTLSGADRTLTTSDSAVSFVSTVNSESGHNRGVALALGTGQATFGGVVGGTRALGAIGITGTLDLNANVEGATSLSVSGAADLGGSVTTTGTQTYSGAVTLSGGARTLAASIINTQSTLAGEGHALTITGAADIDGAYSNLSSLSISGAADLGANITTTGTQSYSGAVTLSGADTTLTGSTINTQSTLAGGGNALTITGAADIDGAYTGLSSLSVLNTTDLGANVTTSGTQTYSGAMTVSANSQLSGSGLSLTAVALASGGAGYALTLSNTDATSAIAGVVSGAGSLFKTGAGTLTLNGANTYAGTTSVNAGTLKLGHANALGSGNDGSGTTVGAGASLDLNELTVTEPVTLAGGRILNGVLGGSMALTADSAIEAASGSSLTLSGVISGDFGLSIGGGGTVRLTGDNSFTGQTTVSSGTLAVGHANALGSAAGATVVGAGGTLDLLNVAVVSEALTLNGGTLKDATSSWGGTVTLGADSTVDIQSGDQLTIGGVISGAGRLTKVGAGDLVLSANNTYTGGTTIGAGVVKVSADLNLGAAPGVQADNNLELSGGVLHATSGFTLNALRGLSVTGASTFTTDASVSVNYAGIMAGTAGLTKSGSGTLVLSGANTHTGTLTVAQGTLQVGAGGSTGALAEDSAIAVYAGGTLVFNRSNAYTVANIISGAGAFKQSGSGVLTLSGDNSGFTGASHLAAGTLNVGHANALGVVSSSGNISFTGGTLQFSDANQNDYSARLATTASQPVRIDTNAQSVTFASALAGAGASLTKLGIGTLSLTGANTYTGATATEAGTLEVTGTLADTTDVSVTSGATYAVASTDTVGSLNGAGAITLASGKTLSTGGTANDSLSGVISGAGSLTKLGSGTLTLSGANTYSGATTVSAGTLQLTGSLSELTDLVLAGTSTWDLRAAQTVASLNMASGSSVVRGAGTSSLRVAGAATLANALTTSGTQQYDSGLTLAANTTLAGSTIHTKSTLAGAGNSLTITGAADIDANYTGLSSLSISGTTDLGGNVTSTGTQTYSEAVALSGGDRTLTTSNNAITFANTVNSESGQNRALTLALGTGQASFGNTVGGAQALGAIGITGTLDLNAAIANAASLSIFGAADLGGNVTTTGMQTYADAVTVSAASTLSTSNGNVSFGGSVSLGESLTVNTGEGAGDITVTGSIEGARALSLSAGSGAITLSGTLGQTARLGAVTLNSSGATTLAQSVRADSVTTNAGGSLVLNGGSVDTTVAQTYGEGITLGADTTLTGTTINTQSTLAGGGNALTITGAANIDGDYSNLISLSISNTTDLGGNVTTSGAQTYSGAVTLSGADRTLTTTNDAVIFSSTVNSESGENRALSLALGTGQATFGGVVGGIRGLGAVGITGALDLNANVAGAASLTVSGAADLGGNVTTSGAQTYSGAVALSGGARTLTGSIINTRDILAGGANALAITGAADIDGDYSNLSSLSISGPTDLGGNVTTSGTQTYSNAVTLSGADRTLRTTNSAVSFSSTVSSESGENRGLSLALGNGQATFGNTVGGTRALGAIDITGALDLNAAIANAASLSVTGASDLGANVTTSGTQTYAGAVTLSGGARTLAGSTIHTHSTLAGGGNALAITGAADIDGDYSGLSNFRISGAADVGANITTTGTQNYGGAVTLSSGNRTLTGSTIQTQRTLAGGGNALTIAGDADIDEAYTGLSGLSILGTANMGANVTTTGTQTYSNTVTLSSNVALQSDGPEIKFLGTVDGDVAGQRALFLSAGKVTFTNSVGENAALASLATTSIPAGSYRQPVGETIMEANVGSVRTTGDQTYNNLTLNTNTRVSKGSGNVVVTVNTEDGRMTETFPVQLVSNAGALNFRGTIEGGEKAKTNMRSLILKASTNVTFNDRVGFDAVSGNSGDILANYTRHFGIYRLDVTAPVVNILGNITAYEHINIRGDAFIGGHANQAETRYVFSLDPAVNFLGKVDGYGLVDGTYSLDARAIGFDRSVIGSAPDSAAQPVINFAEDVGARRSLAGLTTQVAVLENMGALRGSGADSIGGAASRSQASVSSPGSPEAGTVRFGGNVTTTGAQSHFANRFVVSGGGVRGTEFNAASFDATIGSGGFTSADGGRPRLRFSNNPSGDVLRALQRAGVSITSMPNESTPESVMAEQARQKHSTQAVEEALEQQTSTLPVVEVGDLSEGGCGRDSDDPCKISLPSDILFSP